MQKQKSRSTNCYKFVAIGQNHESKNNECWGVPGVLWTPFRRFQRNKGASPLTGCGAEPHGFKRFRAEFLGLRV